MKAASRLQLAEHMSLKWYVIPDLGLTVDDVIKPEYWAHVARQLRPGHRIEVLSEDGSWWADLIVRSSGMNEAIIGVIAHVEFDGEVREVSGELPFDIKWISPTRKYGVVRKSDGERIKDEFQTREAAVRWAQNRARQAA